MREGFVRLVVVTIVGVISVVASLYFIALNKNERRLVVSALQSVCYRLKMIKKRR